MRTKFRVSNHSVFGTIGKPVSSSGLTAHLNRYIHLETPNKVKTGDILKSETHGEYLLISDRSIPGYEIFVGLTINTHLDISEMVEIENEITKRKHTIASPVRTSVPACQERSRTTDEKGFTVPVTRYYIAGEISPTSVVNNKNIQNVEYLLGISHFEVA